MKVTHFRAQLLAASALACAATSFPAMAQDTATPPPEVASNDVIVVSGFRQSLENALNRKRDAGNIVDAISAEDIGKSTDQNIAEALQRVTGISIGREEGEGTTVTVRGVNPNLNNITLNGVPLTSSGDSQGVNLSEFSSDILSAIEVQKTPSASTDEGSLGATIKLIGFRPLNVRKNRRTIEIQGRYGDFAEKTDYKAQLALSQKFLDNTLGISIVASRETQSGRRDRVQSDWTEINNFRNGANVDGLGVVRAYDVNGDGIIETDQNGNGNPNQPNDGELSAWGVSNMAYYYDLFDRDRDTVQVGIQARPWDGADLLITSTYANQKFRRDQSFIQAPNEFTNLYSDILLIDPETRNLYQNIKFMFANDVATSSPLDPSVGITNQVGTPPYFDQRPTRAIRHGRDIFEDTQENWVHSFDFKQELGDFTINLSGGRSETEQKDGVQTRAFWRMIRNFAGQQDPLARSNIGVGYTCDELDNGNLQCRIVQSPGDPDFVVPNFPNNQEIAGQQILADQIPIYDYGRLFEPQSYIISDRSGDDIANSIYADVEWKTDFGPITGIEVGGKWQDRSKSVNSQFTQCGNDCLRGTEIDPITGETITGPPILSGLFLNNYTSENAPSNFASALGYARDEQTDGWPLVDMAAVDRLIADAGATGALSPRLEPLQLLTLEQEVYGGYVQVNYELFDGRVFGDFGGRYAKTKVSGSGPSFVQFEDFQGFGGAENLCAFGFCEGPGLDDLPDTATQAEAQAALDAVRFPLVGIEPDGGIQGNGQSATFTSTETNEYDNWLPSFNVNWIAMDDLIVRFAASETIARPPIGELYPRFSIREDIFGSGGRSAAQIGATQLRPFKSRNLDLSVEWYFDQGSLLSVALFNKDLKDFTQRNTLEFLYRDVRSIYYDTANPLTRPDGLPQALAFTADEVLANGDAAPNTSILLPYSATPVAGCMPNRENNLLSPNGPEFCDVIRTTVTQNGSGGHVRGVEVGLTHSFDNWPGFWGGFGFQANYTYADSQADEQVNTDPTDPTVILGVVPATAFENTSEHTYNFTVFWEKKGSLVRLAYSGRTDYVLNRGNGDFQRWAEGIDSLDLSANWNVNKWFSVNFQAINLLDAVTREYQTVRQDRNSGSNVLPAEESTLGKQYRGRTAELSNTGRIFRLGARFNF